MHTHVRGSPQTKLRCWLIPTRAVHSVTSVSSSCKVASVLNGGLVIEPDITSSGERTAVTACILANLSWRATVAPHMMSELAVLQGNGAVQSGLDIFDVKRQYLM